MKILILSVALVVAGLTANAQRFSLPQGTEALKAYFQENVTFVSALLQATNSVEAPFDARGAWLNYSPGKGDLTEFANELISKCLADFLADVSFNAETPERLAGYEYTMTVTAVKPREDGERWYKAFALQVSKPFGFENTAPGTWEVIGGHITVDESRLYGGQFNGSPNSMVVVETTNVVKWVEYRAGGASLRDGVEVIHGEGSILSRTGWPPGCWAEESWEKGGLLGNGYSYVYSSWLSGDRLLDYFLQTYQDAINGSPKYLELWGLPLRYTDKVIFWYDEERTQGDEFTVTASLKGLTYGWRQLGRATITITPERELSVTLAGYEPNVEYVVYSVTSLESFALTSTKPSSQYDLVMADKSGKLSFTRPINPELGSEFFIVRPNAVAERVSLSATNVP